MTRLALGCVALLVLGACDDEGGDDSGTSVGATSGASSTTDDASTSAGPTTTGESTGAQSTTSGEAGSSSSDGPGDSSSGGGGSSTGNPNACDPQVPGEWNACIDENGSTDNTLCNWMGLSGPSGFIGCLTSSQTKGANVCMISGCEDVCDCFAAPETGDAVVECAEVLEGGGRACVLNCSNGEACPDGMSCEGGLCFHLPQ
ncbi:MAG: hypothetical protein ACE37F_09005 [Nannocystaceae bacterium]|nr:hypothetical protein [bacterium]